ncbi:MAG: hypothetical protein R3268_15570 [Acidiferrobacterales bacterium]|nr:hypothetical protein [Acidiferrobacterales bacterium]
MKIFVRSLAVFLAMAITLFMLATMISIFARPGDAVSIVTAIPIAVLVGWWLWRATSGVTLGPIASILVGSLVTGASAFALIFLGLLLFAPDANQGPLLAIFIVGPLGLVAGGVGGFIVWLKRRDSVMTNDKRKNGPKDLASLTKEERRHLEEKFGINLSDTSDFAELKKRFDKTRAKIEESERKAMRKLGLDDEDD